MLQSCWCVVPAVAAGCPRSEVRREPVVQKGPRAEGLRSYVSSVSGVWRDASAGCVPANTDRSRPAGHRTRAVSSSRQRLRMGRDGMCPRSTATCRVVNYCLTLLELDKTLLIEAATFVTPTPKGASWSDTQIDGGGNSSKTLAPDPDRVLQVKCSMRRRRPSAHSSTTHTDWPP